MKLTPEQYRILRDIATFIAKETGKLPDLTFDEDLVYFEVFLDKEENE